MVSDRCFCSFFLVLLFFLSRFFIASSTPTAFISVSDEIFESQTSMGRRLLQTKKACPIDFEHMNYTTFINKCKGPRYPPELCCTALAEFVCPYLDYVEDVTSDCAVIMFGYLDLHGNYPGGLFSSECPVGDKSLDCPIAPAPLSIPNLAMPSTCPSSAMILAYGLMLLLSWLF